MNGGVQSRNERERLKKEQEAGFANQKQSSLCRAERFGTGEAVAGREEIQNHGGTEARGFAALPLRACPERFLSLSKGGPNAQSKDAAPPR